MKTKVILILIVSILVSFPLFSEAQKEYDIWYFGENAGVDFNTGNPVVLTNGQIDTEEGTSVICDSTGNLLFYTDGEKVLNRNHQQMPNGFGLSGSFSSSQSALIVKKPGSNRYYYIFTTDAQFGIMGGCGCLSYSVVDMSLNGGTGDVTQKNIILSNVMEEKISGVLHRNRQDIWIVSHQGHTNRFLAYKVTSAGVDTNPVISDVGQVHDTPFDEIGQLKFSPNGKKIVVSTLKHYFELFDFDRSSGLISNPVVIQPPFTQNSYGVEFSPNSKFLYTTAWYTYLLQFDISSGISASINNSMIIIDSTLLDPNGSGNVNQKGSLKLAKNGKIYMSKTNTEYLSVINSPNLPGFSCGFVYEGLLLNNRLSKLGLPNSIVVPNEINWKNKCLKDTSVFTIDDTLGVSHINWDYNDPGGNTMNTLFTGKHVFSDTGNYNVKVIIYYYTGVVDTLKETVTIKPLPLKLLNDTIICQNNAVTLNAGNLGCNFMWSTGDTTQTVTINNSGLFVVRIKNSFGCEVLDSCKIARFNSPYIALHDTSFCFGNTITLAAGSPSDIVHWSTGDTSNTVTINHTCNLTIFITDTNGCSSSRTILVKRINSDFAYIHANPGSTSVYDPNIQFAVTPDTTYMMTQWEFGDGAQSQIKNPFHTYSDTGWFNVTLLVKNSLGCIDSNMVKIYIYPDYDIYVPNAFTPDNDGLNDTFKPESACLRDYSMFIYNRWGQLLFETRDIRVGWDGSYHGEKLPSNVYVYKIFYKDCMNRSKIKSGACALIR
jgi:gliding motility-associated-like protein